MIVYQNSLLTLTYLQEIDVLIVTWSKMEPYASSQVQESMQNVVEAINNYNCRNLLIDASIANTTLEDVEFRNFQVNFVADLSHEKIQKLARIITSDRAREELVDSIRSELFLPFQFQDFSNREQAIKWLTSEK